METFLLIVALCGVVWVGVFSSLALFSLYRVDKKPGDGRFAGWSFSLEGEGSSLPRLALVSLLGLFLEMLIIRWVSSEIRVFAYFKNFVLIACFLGFGMGCYLCRKRVNLLPVFIPMMLLTALIVAPWTALRHLIGGLPILLGASSDVAIWGVPTVPFDSIALGGLALAVLIVIPIFALIALIFVPIGQMVGWHLEQARNGIRGYSLNVFASLVGILLYTLLCYVDQAPPVWIALAGAMLAMMVWNAPRLRWGTLAVFGLCAAAAAVPQGAGTTYWSPYQKLGLTPVVTNGETTAYELNTNDSWYQHIIDLSPAFAASHPQLFAGEQQLEWDPYNVPYQFAKQPPSVLVLGAGMGNDVAAALRAGAQNVVAVEIDPLIVDLGKRLHFEKPYQSGRVHTVIDDARSYMQNSQEQFDLIMFSLLDSHTTSSYYSNIRIDNYVYTVEALSRAKRLMKPDGLFIIKFQVDTPWIAGRLQGLVERVFPSSALVRIVTSARSTQGHFFIVGSKNRIAGLLAEPKIAAYVNANRDTTYETATLTTDDWPYFYQHEPGLPLSVIVISLCLVAVCWYGLRQTEVKQVGIHWHFFFLGAGFMLLEAQIISRMALLFGTTWMVNSIVVAGLLLLILGANSLVEVVKRVPLPVAYAGVFLTIVAGSLVPMDWLFFPSMVLRILASVLILCLPVFFAGIIFIQSFAAEGFAGSALGSNLMGALVGGLLESLSMWTGMKSMLVLAALLYLGSYMTRKVGTVPEPARGKSVIPMEPAAL
jgi:spermidine synthase